MTATQKFRRRRPAGGRKQDGYILLTLMFVAAITAIFLAAVLPQFSQQIRRDREEELIHRGVQYSRAIRKYYKKFGRYPVRLEELENTNNIRFLRKRYKDPLTDKDFKVLHFGEVKMAFGPGIAGATPAGQPVAGGLNAPASTITSTSGPTLTPRPGSSVTSSTTTDGSSSSPSSSSDSSSSSPGPSGSLSGLSSSSNPTSQVFGGGPIVGVVSSSTKQSIREFNKKNHYNDWQFIYDPSTDRGGLLNTPAQPALQPVGGQQNPPGVPSLGGAGAQGMTPSPMQPPQPQQPPQQLQPPSPPDQ